MMRRFKAVFVALLLVLTIYPVPSVFAEDPSYDDADYWRGYCTLSYENQHSEKCKEFYKYYFDKLEKEQADNEAAEEAAKGDYEKANKLATQYAKDIEVLKKDITDLNKSIDTLNKEIKVLVDKINDNEDTVDRLNAQVLTRMASKQGTMHFNPFLDFVLGSTSFSDMLRRSYGLNVIMGRDKEIRVEIEEIIKQLDSDKQSLEGKRENLNLDKEILEIKQADLEEKRAFQFAAMEEAQLIIQEAQMQNDKIAQVKKDMIDEIDDMLDVLPPNSYLMHPVKDSWVSSGFPYYPEDFGGGVHLGIDYAAGLGTPLYAPANGIVIVASDGCPTWGGLGNNCGWQNGGINSGGNQVHMVMAAGGTIYGMIIMHAENGTIAVNVGDVVEQGQYLANVGSSGSSTGPHAHVELFLLGYGDQSDLSDYASAGYSLGFDCGWGYYGLSHICDRGAGIPCRLDGRDYFK